MVSIVTIPSLAEPQAVEIYRRFSDAYRADDVAPDAAHFECTETVFGRPAQRREVRRHLRRLPLAETLGYLGAITLELRVGRHPTDAVLQVRVARVSAGVKLTHPAG